MPIARAAPRIALALSLALPARAPAQVRASEAASVSQTVDGTKITIEYSRPRGRARDSLFGKVVPWGEVWTAGANLATLGVTSLDLPMHHGSRPVEFRGLRAGELPASIKWALRSDSLLVE